MNRFDVERILFEAHKVFDIFKVGLHETIVVGMVIVLRPGNFRHQLLGFGCIVDLKVNGVILLSGRAAYHRELDDAVFGQQSSYKRCMLLTNVGMVIGLAQARLTVRAYRPLEELLGGLTDRTHVESADGGVDSPAFHSYLERLC